MKIWADLSSVARLAAVCVLIGFLLGLFAACSVLSEPTSPDEDRARPAGIANRQFDQLRSGGAGDPRS